MYVVGLYLTKIGIAKLFAKVIALLFISACIPFVPPSCQQLEGQSLNINQSSICVMILIVLICIPLMRLIVPFYVQFLFVCFLQ